MTKAHILRVFCDERNHFGDTASVVVDEGKRIPDNERQAIAQTLATGETIFINSLGNPSISVMHPQGEIDFAGVGVLGVAWLLAKLQNKPLDTLNGRGGMIKTWQDGDLTWIEADSTTSPRWNYKQESNVETIENIQLADTSEIQHTMIWAWIDETSGTIRARTFAADWDIPEAMGNGSGSMLLAKQLNRSIEIRHGQGSVIFAKPNSGDLVSLGGRVYQEQGPLV
jgi:predicted PhzF superfamily epimerase YddE/YHI9